MCGDIEEGRPISDRTGIRGFVLSLVQFQLHLPPTAILAHQVYSAIYTYQSTFDRCQGLDARLENRRAMCADA